MSKEDVSGISRSSHASPWPRVIIGVFILLALGNAVILYLALSTKVAPMDEQPYEAGLQYETTIVEKQAAKSDGVSVKFVPSESGIVASVAGLPEHETWNGEIELIRPSDSSLDRRATVIGAGPDFDFTLGSSQSGLWIIRLRLIGAFKKYYFEDRAIFGPD